MPVAVVAVLIGVGAIGGAACSSIASGSDSDTEGSGAAYGWDDDPSYSAGFSTSASYGSPATSGSGTNQIETCDDLSSCQGDGVTPASGCIECAVLGDSSVASDGGECADEFAACFGDDSEACTGASDPECCPLYDCLQACDTNGNGFIDPGPELDCLCTNDGTGCAATQGPGTCAGDYPKGFQTAIAWEDCAFVIACPSCW